VRLVLRAHAAGVALALLASVSLFASPAQAAIIPPTPIQHVVVIYQENHTFDNVLGTLCTNGRCDGVRTGKLPSGETIPLSRATDIVPGIDHSRSTQKTAINGGTMNGFANIPACTEAKGYQCYTQYYPGQIPNLAALARRFVISDRTFSMDPIASWGAHLELVAAQLDGFTGSLPVRTPATGDLKGWGCDSNRDAAWRATPTAKVQMVPSCVPDFSLNPIQYPYGGAYRPTPVNYVPTIMDRLNQTHRSWRIYASEGPGIGSYGWAICPTFAECLYKQRSRMVDSERIITDAKNDKLPSLSLVMPEGSNSQHNFDSMAKGDNWIGNVVGAIQGSADWPHTAIFITYDDCGCFYDHVRPPVKRWGLRMPMVIVSPYAKPHYTDSNNATFASMLAFTEHVFGLSPLSARDANAYDYADAFNFNQPVLRTAKMTTSHISKRERQYLEAHPGDPDDPT
jgi:phospholipase C